MKIVKKKTILLVEDEAVSALMCKKVLEKHGFEVIHAPTGERAVEIVEINESIDLILMDIDLGEGIDGTEAAEIILSKKDLPLVFLSSHTEPEIVNKTKSITNYGYVVKNTGEVVLIASLEMAMKLFSAKMEIQNYSFEIEEANEKLEAAIKEKELANEELILSKEELVHREKTLLRNNKLLGNNVARNNALLENTTALVSIFDADGRYIDISESFAQFLNTRRDEVKGAAFSDFLPAETVHDFMNTVSHIQKTHEPVFKIDRFTVNGERRIFETRLFPVETEHGSITSFGAISTEITKREKAEERLKIITDNMFDLVSLTDMQGNFTFLGNSHEILGYDMDFLIGKNVMDFVHPDDLPAVADEFTEFIKNGKDKRKVEYRYRCADDRYIWLETIGIFIKDENGEVNELLFSSRDITERKNIEFSLHNTLNLFDSLIETVPVPIFYKDKEGRYTGFNKAFEEFFGKSRNDLIGKSVFDINPPELAEKYNEKDAELFSNPGVQVYTYRVKSAAGGLRNVVFHKATTLDAQGNVNGLVGAILDITGLKQSELELKESEERFKALHNASFGGIAIHDKGIILDCNQGLAEMTGYSFDELIGMDGLLLIAEQSRELVVNNILTGFEQPYEAFGVRKSGEVYPLRLEARKIPYKGKEVRVVEFRDLTEVKKTELIDHAVIMLSEFSHRNNINSTIQKLIDTIEEFTGSEIGFYLLVDEKEETLIPAAWSSNTIDTMCSAEVDSTHYAVSKAGVWADCVKKRQSVIHNDYESLPHKKGLPAGHAPVMRLLVVPVIINDRIKAVIGVGNKKHNYDENDITVVKRLADMTWHIIERKQLEELLKQQIQEKEILLQEIIHRIKNNIASLEDLLLFQTGYASNPDVRSALQDAVARIQGMRIIYEKLLLTDNYKDVSVRSYISGLVSDIVNIFPDSQKVAVESEIEDFQIDVKNAQVLGIITNELITNSMKYAFTGRDSGLIRIFLSRNNENLILIVHDNGVGLPEGFNVNTSSGLGLMLITMLSAQTNGSFLMENDNGTRSRVEISLKDSASTEEMSENVINETEPAVSKSQGPLILIADDLIVNRVFLKTGILKLLPEAEIIEASNGKEAVELTEKYKPDLVFMDIQMPVLDGLEAVVKIRKELKGLAAEVPVIAFSADDSDLDKERCHNAGMNDLLVKPVDSHKLERVFSTYLDFKK